MINIELFSFFHIRCTLCIVDVFEDIIEVVVHCSHSVDPFFCSSGTQFVVVGKEHIAYIKTTETSE